jgi:hypothetical protein
MADSEDYFSQILPKGAIVGVFGLLASFAKISLCPDVEHDV